MPYTPRKSTTLCCFDAGTIFTQLFRVVRRMTLTSDIMAESGSRRSEAGGRGREEVRRGRRGVAEGSQRIGKEVSYTHTQRERSLGH